MDSTTTPLAQGASIKLTLYHIGKAYTYILQARSAGSPSRPDPIHAPANPAPKFPLTGPFSSFQAS